MENKKKILVVDDEQDLIEFVKIRLEANNYDVDIAYDGEEALKAINKSTPDLIILDIVLPKLDGYKVCELIKKDAKTADIPVIMFTARDQKEDIILAQKAGADGYICKPFDAHVLLAKIIESLNKSRNKD